ncbi:hypothetical protein [Sediminicurvatus halobius]|uniref:Uncharacterized protein n=1 Tax=Sediminicurvatus halobius TaxID=2182432 RepID=A0A2U2MXI3_9GAMM|nr:hypothetical protein [Spiribacter halobius]PWG61595.1 hypothetical protein DEM34_15510 [Spiribacter halobius]UEX77273.1 hypothetical protein LMH63_15180 [Spiribacter halobius]
MNPAKLTGGVILALCLAGPGKTQGLSAEDILGEAQQQSARIDDVLALLDHPDPHVRILALQRMVREGSDYERRLGLQRAFISGDEGLRHAAIKHRLEEMPTLPVVLAIPEEDAEAVHERVRALFTTDGTFVQMVPMGEMDFRTGQFLVQPGTGDGSPGFVNGDTVSFQFRPGQLYNRVGHCAGELELTSELALAGVARCQDLQPPLQMTIQLF